MGFSVRLSLSAAGCVLLFGTTQRPSASPARASTGSSQSQGRRFRVSFFMLCASLSACITFDRPKRFQMVRKKGISSHLPLPAPGKSAIALPGAEEARLQFPQRLLASPRVGERCREATERGRLIQCFPSQAQAPALPTLPRGASQGDGCAFYSLSRISRSISSHTAANSRSISRLLKRNIRSPRSFSRSSRTRSLSFPDSS